MPTFEIYRANGELQLNLASQLPQTIGVIEVSNYPNGSFYTGTVYIPEWVGKRGWFSFEGTTAVTTIWAPFIYRTGDSLYFNLSTRQQGRPRIKYGVY